MLVAVGAVLFAGETNSTVAMIGVICLAVGVMTLTLEKSGGSSINQKAILFALAQGFVSHRTQLSTVLVRGRRVPFWVSRYG